ncbi:MAG: class II aldolase/adducin family protein [Clostridia bacterium]|nr:class II aldolase/adducin family protein [Clostridia bacterium]MBT7122194.1 class II aldolase/adducin family protein [Clostridia bacterium]
MYETQKKAVIETALKIREYGLIALAGGNVSMRLPDGDILVTPSGTYYETMRESDVLLMDSEGNIKEGDLKPSVDTIALLYIYKNMPEVNAIIHTHQTNATAVGLISDKLPAVTTTLSNVTLGEVNVAPYSSPASLNMGIETVKHINGKRAIILKHHGVVTVGGNLKEAMYAAIYMEESAKAYLLAKACKEPDVLTAEQSDNAAEIFKDVGQSK